MSSAPPQPWPSDPLKYAPTIRVSDPAAYSERAKNLQAPSLDEARGMIRVAMHHGLGSLSQFTYTIKLAHHLVQLIRTGKMHIDDYEEWEDATVQLDSQNSHLAAIYDSVAHWWVANSPPSFEATAASVLEGILVRSVRLQAMIEEVAPPSSRNSTHLTCLCVARHSAPLEEETVAAALRCEARLVTSREPIAIDNGFNESNDLINHARFMADKELPIDWYEMTDDQRIVAMSDTGPHLTNTSDEVPMRDFPRRAGRPRDDKMDLVDQRVFDLRETKTPWGEIAKIIFDEFGIKRSPNCLQRRHREFLKKRRIK